MTTHRAPIAFDAQASTYDRERRILIPPYDAFYGTAVEALDLARRPIRHVLDLGAGTGLLAARVAAAHPDAALTLVDGAPRMLDRARGLLGDGAAYRTGDLRDPLPEGGWDAVVSALAIHHLEVPDVAGLCRRVHAALRPGGVFVDAEQVTGPSPTFARHYDAWHEAGSRRGGASDAMWAAAAERKRMDRCTDVGTLLAVLRDAGFAEADCLFKDRCFAVVVALKD
jgi:tRNA (cmo5U34)-methyltransferase